MYLKHLQLSNFKNYEAAEFDFNENVNAVIGNNGCGKTNLLDAIYYLSFCKSYFVPQDAFSVRFNTDYFAIHGDFFSRNLQNSTRISCTYKINGRKVMKANKKEYGRFSDHIGLYPLVMVSPTDSEIINGGSDIRRKFVDIIISQFDKEYLAQLIAYQKLIIQRNTLLKQLMESKSADFSLIAILNEQLIVPGNYIHQQRAAFINDLLPVFQQHYAFLSDDKEAVSIHYESGLNKISFEQGLADFENNDRNSGYSGFGVHKDDFIFLINERPVKRFASQGQQKSYSLALRLAQFDYIFTRKQVKPILLLDDIFDKLDKQRITQLLNLVGKDHFGQVFISDTDGQRVSDILHLHNIENKIINIMASDNYATTPDK